ncbi:MAG: hypothetical protein IIV20_03695, partial [Bacteroidaceae bacterium]|nr:hypothetical protein [Bacteroidaceae bacterium]
QDWYWNIGANVAWNQNRIMKLTSDDERADYQGVATGGISGGVGNTIQVHQTGQPMNSFFVYQQVYDVDGKPIEGLYVGDKKHGDFDGPDYNDLQFSYIPGYSDDLDILTLDASALSL